MDFLPGSFGFDPLGWTAEPEFASQVLWFDALVHNVDRTWRNPNLLVWHRNIWLIEARLLAVDPAADLDAVRAALSAFEQACTEGPLSGRPLGERFRWLTAPRSTIVQPGPVHSGLTADPAAELTHLLDTLVR